MLATAKKTGASQSLRLRSGGHSSTNILVLCIVITFPMIGLCQSALGQQTPADTESAQQDLKPNVVLIGKIPDIKGMNALVLNDLKVVGDDVQTLFNDIGLGSLSFIAAEALRLDAAKGMDSRAGIVLMGQTELYNFNGSISKISDNKTFQEWIGSNQIDSTQKEYSIINIDPVSETESDSVDFILGTPTTGFVADRHWFQFRETNEYASEQEFTNQQWLEKIKSAKPLVDSLHPDVHKSLLTSGISTIIGGKSLAEFMPPANWLESEERFQSRLTDHENSALASLTSFQLERGIVGLKYDDRVLECRAFAQLETQNELDELFDIDAAIKGWNPDLGFESDGLLIATSFQMGAYRSSALPRLLPRIALAGGRAQPGFRFLRGNMLGSLAELIGDSWNDLSVARIGIYQLAEKQKTNGQFCIFGIVDADNPAVVIEELRRISVVTGLGLDTAASEIQAIEFDRLVKQLRSDDLNLVARAETRLAMGRGIAKSRMQLLAKSPHPIVASRADRVLRKIEARESAKTTDLSVDDPMFWSTLNPVLSFTKATDGTPERIDHTIQIAPDPSKSEQEVRRATEMMQFFFGDSWNRITVVQLPGHFVFMVGSDRSRLDRIVKNIRANTSNLRSSFDGIGKGHKDGAIHLFANLQRLKMVNEDVTGRTSRKSPVTADDVKRSEPPIVWAGGNLFEDHIEIWALVPASQIMPFVGF